MKHVIDFFHHLLLPRQSNNFRSKLLHHDLLTAYLVFALVITLGVSHFQNQNGSILGFATDISTQKLLTLTNEERAKDGLSELSYNLKLEEAAQKKAKDMFAKDYWSHYGPSGETPWDFILDSDYQYEYAGENLAKNFLFSGDVVNAWMNSETHRDNILRKEYSEVGFAIVNGVLNDEETTLVVQMFGKPLYPVSALQKKMTPEVTLENDSIPAKIPNVEAVLSDTETNLSFFPTYLNINLVFFAVLVFALFLDFYFASKLKLIHLKGKNLIHIFFIIFATIGTFIILKGSIL
ncbi:hypothetical protein COY14_03995 [Candidatus Roizmanbacteria bacterium CG_4_10_14_0_2_um_filter_36_9]|uniref:SCP domain-containing protein n=1 Tax=Candidatus Roizmanbacteria bacterium CG_4_10_14_0_2_um_filter_36_9 TaxID=1974823 RepID=A0A2M7U328_9BACT|nr:MAG: hypothetical protein COY14_03995 [Candidatus Roizmanbacteria bacterium CG_4_10_14_0_2_um_filter_36_9]